MGILGSPGNKAGRGRATTFACLLSVMALGAAGCSGGPVATPGPTGTGSTPLATGGGGTAPSGSPLVGSWTTTITKTDLQAAGITDPGFQNENSGRFTFTFGPDGTWTQVQESLDASTVMNPVFRGTYTVDGSAFVATTTFPEEYADAGLHYGWMIAGSDLQLDLLDPPDNLLPVIMETHPWTRTAG
jgi:hypothetical protein